MQQSSEKTKDDHPDKTNTSSSYLGPADVQREQYAHEQSNHDHWVSTPTTTSIATTETVGLTEAEMLKEALLESAADALRETILRMSEEERVTQALKKSLGDSTNVQMEETALKETCQELLIELERAHLAATGVPIRGETREVPNDGNCMPRAIELLVELEQEAAAAADGDGEEKHGNNNNTNTDNKNEDNKNSNNNGGPACRSARMRGLSGGWLREAVLGKLTEDKDGRYSKMFGAGRRVTFQGETYVEDFGMHVKRVAQDGEFWEDPEIQVASDVLHRVVRVYYLFAEGGKYYHVDANHPSEFTPLSVDDDADDRKLPPLRLVLYTKCHSASHCEPLLFLPIDMDMINHTSGVGRREEKEEEEELVMDAEEGIITGDQQQQQQQQHLVLLEQQQQQQQLQLLDDNGCWDMPTNTNGKVKAGQCLSFEQAIWRSTIGGEDIETEVPMLAASQIRNPTTSLGGATHGGRWIERLTQLGETLLMNMRVIDEQLQQKKQGDGCWYLPIDTNSAATVSAQFEMHDKDGSSDEGCITLLPIHNPEESIDEKKKSASRLKYRSKKREKKANRRKKRQMAAKTIQVCWRHVYNTQLPLEALAVELGSKSAGIANEALAEPRRVLTADGGNNERWELGGSGVPLQSDGRGGLPESYSQQVLSRVQRGGGEEGLEGTAPSPHGLHLATRESDSETPKFVIPALVGGDDGSEMSTVLNLSRHKEMITAQTSAAAAALTDLVDRSCLPSVALTRW